ncbi:MAG TPA: hypothetical protein VEH77_01670 [Roseiarcus sp.]|nr:hypothetical protein [Roseiarcus sp.]
MRNVLLLVAFMALPHQTAYAGNWSMRCEEFIDRLTVEIHRAGDLVATPGEYTVSRPDNFTTVYSFSGIVGIQGKIECRGADQGVEANKRWLDNFYADTNFDSTDETEKALRIRRLSALTAAALCISAGRVPEERLEHINSWFRDAGNRLNMAIKRGENYLKLTKI